MKEWIFYSGEEAEEQPRQRTTSSFPVTQMHTLVPFLCIPALPSRIFSLSCSLLISCSPLVPSLRTSFHIHLVLQPGGAQHDFWAVSQCPVCWAPSLAQTSDHWFPLSPVQTGLWVIQRRTTSWTGTHSVWVCGFLIHRGALFRGGPLLFIRSCLWSPVLNTLPFICPWTSSATIIRQNITNTNQMHQGRSKLSLEAWFCLNYLHISKERFFFLSSLE